ncbi:MAG: ECF transporter S component, partial [Sphaerochaetaceae bacterium]
EGIFETKHKVIYAICCILGNVIAFGLITPIFTVIFYGGDLEVTFIQAFAATLGNFAVLVVIGIPLLKILANRYKSRTNLSEEHGDEY